MVTDSPAEGDGDRAEHFEHAGLDCKIVKTSLGHWCGYVRRPESVEPVRWMGDYDSKHDEVLAADVDVWCGVTYGPDGDGWVGFDDAHATKLVEQKDRYDTDRAAVKSETEALAEQIARLIQQADRDPGDGESYGGAGHIRPVPADVPPTPEADDE